MQLLINQKIKNKKAFIKSRNPFLKSALNSISKKIKKQIKTHRSADIKKRIQSFQISNDSKSWRTLKKEMGYPSKWSSYPSQKIALRLQKQIKINWSNLPNIWNLCLQLKLNLRNFGIHSSNWKVAKVIILHKAGKLEDLVGSYWL